MRIAQRAAKLLAAAPQDPCPGGRFVRLLRSGRALDALACFADAEGCAVEGLGAPARRQLAADLHRVALRQFDDRQVQCCLFFLVCALLGHFIVTG